MFESTSTSHRVAKVLFMSWRKTGLRGRGLTGAFRTTLFLTSIRQEDAEV